MTRNELTTLPATRSWKHSLERVGIIPFLMGLEAPTAGTGWSRSYQSSEPLEVDPPEGPAEITQKRYQVKASRGSKGGEWPRSALAHAADRESEGTLQASTDSWNVCPATLRGGQVRAP